MMLTADKKIPYSLSQVPIATIQWWSHLTALAVPLDLLLCKDPTTLQAHAMRPAALVPLVTCVCIMYITMTNLLFRKHGRWPYPFLAQFDTWPKQSTLTLGIAAAVTGLCCACRIAGGLVLPQGHLI